MTCNIRRAFYKCAAPFLFLMGASLANAAVTPGQFVVEPATLTSLGFEWYINQGEDPTRNSYVTVQYRPTGTSAWNTGHESAADPE